MIRSPSYQWIVLSPHRDDAVLSCGGLMARRTERGDKMLVINVFTGLGDELRTPLARMMQAKYGRPLRSVFADRERQDAAALAILGVDRQNLGISDALSRGCGNVRELFAPPVRSDGLITTIADGVLRIANGSPDAILLAPAGIGRHVDHVLLSRAARAIASEREVWLYEDLPYAAMGGAKYECGSTRSELLVETNRWFETKRRSLQEYASECEFFAGVSVDLVGLVDRHALALGAGDTRFERYWVPGSRSVIGLPGDDTHGRAPCVAGTIAHDMRREKECGT